MINAFKAARLTNQTLSGVGSTLTYAGQGLVPYSGSTGNLILGNTQNISVGLVTVGYNGLGSVVSGVGNYYGIQYNMNDNSYWYNGGLYSADGSGIAINANGGVRYLYRGNSYPTVDFANMQLVNGFSNVSIDWLNKILSGAWTVNSLKLVSGATNNTVPLLFSGGYLNVNGQNLAYQVAGGYVPYAGATGTVNLNNQILTGVNSIGVNGNVMPMTNNAYSLGTPLMAWGSAYIGTLVGTGAYLNDMNAVDVNNCKLHADLPGITLDWSGKFLTGGTWQAQNLLISGSPVITAAQTGQFYAANNPLGFVTNAALSGTVVSIGGLSGVINLTGSSGVVITTGGSNLITVALNNSGQFASASAFNNTGAFLQSEINQFSGIVVNTTGAFITTSMTGQFQSASQFVLTGTNIQGQLNALSGILGGTGGFVDLTSTQTIAGAKTFSNLLKATNAGGVQTPYIQGTGFYLNDMNAVDVNNCKLHADLPGITLDWSGKFLTGGTWQAQNLLISGSPVITAAQTGSFLTVTDSRSPTFGGLTLNGAIIGNGPNNALKITTLSDTLIIGAQSSQGTHFTNTSSNFIFSGNVLPPASSSAYSLGSSYYNSWWQNAFITGVGNIGTVNCNNFTLTNTSPNLTLNTLANGSNYATYLGATSSSIGYLQLGNNGTNYIVGGNTAAGGKLNFYVNNTNTFPTTPNGTNVMNMTSSYTEITGTVYFQNPPMISGQPISTGAGGGGATVANLNNTGAFLQSEIIIISGTTGAFLTNAALGSYATTANVNTTGAFLQSEIIVMSGMLGGTGGLLSKISGQMLQSEINQFSGIVVNTTGAFDTVAARNTAISSYATTANVNTTGAFLQSEINQFSGIVIGTTGQFVNTTDSRNLHFTNVGIGQSPSAPLDVLGIIHINAAAGTTFTQGTPALDLFGTTGQYRIGFDSISSSVGYIRYNIVAGGLANTWGHCFSTSQNGTPNTFSNNLFIGATGAVGIQTVTPAYALDVNGAIKTNNQIISTLSIGTQPLNVTSTTMCTNLNANYVGGIALAGLVQSITDGVTTLHGNITMSGSGGITVSIAGQIISITYTSDRRAKRKIKKYKNGAYRLIKKIPIKQWEYNGKAGTNKGEIGIGFIAQEVKDILPHCVGTHKAKLNPKDKKISDVYHLNMPNLVGVLTKAVQELMDDNEKLTTRVEELETKCKKHFLHHKPHAQ